MNVLVSSPASAAPAVPVRARALAKSPTKVNVAWVDASNDEDGFIIQRAANEGGPWSAVASPAADATSFLDTNVLSRTTYFYRIAAVNGTGTSDWSNVSSVTPRKSISLPRAPGDLHVSSGTSSADLIWEDHAGNECGFKIQRSTSGNSPWVFVGTTGGNVTNFTDTGLSDGKYYYRVRAYNLTGTSGRSNTDDTTVGAGGGGSGTMSATIIIGNNTNQWVATGAGAEYVQSSGILDIGGTNNAGFQVSAAICTNFPGTAGTYNLGNSCGGVFNFNTFTFYGAVEGKLVIQTFNTGNQTTSGTFAYTATDGSTTITVTNGMFNLDNLLISQ